MATGCEDTLVGACGGVGIRGVVVVVVVVAREGLVARGTPGRRAADRPCVGKHLSAVPVVPGHPAPRDVVSMSLYCGKMRI